MAQNSRSSDKNVTFRLCMKVRGCDLERALSVADARLITAIALDN